MVVFCQTDTVTSVSCVPWDPTIYLTLKKESASGRTPHHVSLRATTNLTQTRPPPFFGF
jgi:hypothetical protein